MVSGADSQAAGDGDALVEAALASEAFREKEAEFYDALGIDPSQGERAFLRTVHYAPWVAEDLKLLISEAMEGGVVSERNLLERHLSQGIMVRDVEHRGGSGCRRLREVPGA